MVPIGAQVDLAVHPTPFMHIMFGINVSGKPFRNGPGRILYFDDKLYTVANGLVEHSRVEGIREIEDFLRIVWNMDAIRQPLIGRMFAQRVTRFAGKDKWFRCNCHFFARNQVPPILLHHFVDHGVRRHEGYGGDYILDGR